MDYEVLEKWLCEIATNETKPHIHGVIQSIKEFPVAMFAENMSMVATFMRSEPPVCNAVVSGLLMGFIICEAWNRNSTDMKEHFTGYLDFKQKQRGENVVSFFERKADSGRSKD